MSEKLNSIFVPIDYVRELRALGEIDKADAFLSYFADFHDNEWYGFPFYAKRWGVCDKTARQWISEFSNEISLYFASWGYQNSEHYKSVSFKDEAKGL